MQNPKVSIIVPIYNVEKFIKKCLITLFEQDYQNIEYIFINDATPDKSMNIFADVLKNYPNRQNDVILINHNINLGLCKTRMEGLSKTSGKFIVCVDSDDWVEKDMISSLVKKIVCENADIVMCDYYKVGSRKNYKKRDYFKNFSYEKRVDYIAKLLSGKIPISYLPAQIIKKELYDNILFPKISFLEDLMTTIQLILKAKSIKHLEKALYYYNRNNDISITKSKNINQKTVNDIKNFTDDAEIFLKNNNIFDEVKDALYFGTVSRVFMRLKTFSDKLKFKKILSQVSKEACDIKYIKNHPCLEKKEKILLQILFKFF